jgi:hypothetical protein
MIQATERKSDPIAYVCVQTIRSKHRRIVLTHDDLMNEAFRAEINRYLLIQAVNL